MVRAIITGRTALLRLTVGRCKGLSLLSDSGPHPSTCCSRSISGTADGRDTGSGRGTAGLREEIADLNAEIGGFVGDLGDPDFDTTPAASGSLHGAQDESKTSRGVENAARHQQPQRESANHPQSRLTQADHPLFTGANGGSTGGGFKADWSTALTMESQARGITKSVLVLNGAACFVAGKLASTGEPHGDITDSMQTAANEVGLNLTVCTSNREDELLDQLCEGGYDAIVYNPSGFGYGRDRIVPASNAVDPVAEYLLASKAATSRTEGDELPLELRQQQRMQNEFQQHGDSSGSVIEYGIAHAGCPVVILSPRSKSYGAHPHELGHLNEGTIAGFSGVVSYRLAIMAVASMLNEIR